MDKLRIAHINFPPGKSVALKLFAEAEAAAKARLPMDFYLIQSNVKDENKANLYIRNDPEPGIANRWLRLANKLFKRKSNLDKIVDFDRYDLIILRFGKISLRKGSILKRYGRKIITEHHTNEVEELKSKRTIPRWLLAALVSFFSARMLRRVAGIIALTEEIRRVELAKAGPKPSAVITNGVGVDSVRFTSFRPFDGKELTMVCVAARFERWHGIDRLLKGMREYRGPAVLRLILIGQADEPLRSMIAEINERTQSRIEAPGSLYGDGIEELFRRSNLAVGSLGISRNSMREACPIKSREYMARGIPFIYAYDDPDMPADAVFACKLPADESPIDIRRVIEFAGKVSAIPNVSRQMRAFALSRLDWAVKVRSMVAFCEQVYASQQAPRG